MKTVLLLLFLLTQLYSQDITVTFLVNHGWLIEAGDDKIIIDGLFYKHYDEIDSYTADEIKLMENKRAPFTNIDAILVTHQHLDHYHTDLTTTYLLQNKDLNLIAPGQIVKLHNPKQSLGKTNKLGEINTFQIGKIKIEQINLLHMGPARNTTENTGFIVTAAGKTFLHVGDADLSQENYEPYKLIDRKIDYLIIPYWQLMRPEHREIIDKFIKPKTIIPSHIDAQRLIQMPEYLPTLISNGLYFVKHMESKKL